jgi:hypothetical protein
MLFEVVEEEPTTTEKRRRLMLDLIRERQRSSGLGINIIELMELMMLRGPA